MSNPFEFFRTNANVRKANVTQNNALYQDGRETGPVYGPMTAAAAEAAEAVIAAAANRSYPTKEFRKVDDDRMYGTMTSPRPIFQTKRKDNFYD